jgi:hypothetical protein
MWVKRRGLSLVSLGFFLLELQPKEKALVMLAHDLGVFYFCIFAFKLRLMLGLK